MSAPPPADSFNEQEAEAKILGTSILVVDDIADNRDLLQELLCEKNYQSVIQASSGFEALELLHAHANVGLVLLDLMMPGMDGYETCRRITSNERTRHIPVIVVTGGALRRDEALTKSFAAGAMDYVPKPVNEVEFYGRIRSALLLYHERMSNRGKTQALLESQQRFNLAVNGVNDGIWDLDLVHNQIYFSPKWKEILGYAEEELPNQQGIWERLIHPDDLDRVLSSIHEHWEKQTPFYTTEHRLQTKSGEYKWVFSRGRAVWDANGQVVRMAGSTTDITARKNLEIQLRQAQQMESIGRLAAGIAHDFNNLLTAMLGHVNLGKRSLSADSPVHENFDKIQKAAIQAAEFCKQLLAYSGQGRYSIERLDLNPLVRETAELVQVSISRKITVDFDLAPHALMVDADPAQLRQVVLNLVINAAEAIGGRTGVITVRTVALHLRPEELGDAICNVNHSGREYACVEIGDTGCGISPEDQRKIFDPFFTTKFTGRGLGLSAVLGIVKANEGTMKVRSKLGEGTTFTLLLPRVEAALTPAHSPVTSDLDGWRGAGTILVVEDEPIIREVAEAFLAELGFQVLLAEDGLEGVKLFQAHRETIVAVILDLNMPNMSGEEVFQKLKEVKPDVRVLLASGYSEEEAVRRFTSTGSAGFLQKPFMVNDLAAKLRTCLGQVQP